ncbi:MAG: hypothetical protein LQ349_008267 [Xanthoria aureola]|nr:MAG: hypothetical protein LQ349_008267 [Xanthoria aureola]
MKISAITTLLLSLAFSTLAHWRPTETETDTTFLTLTTLLVQTPDPTTTVIETSTAPSPTHPSTHIVTATTTVPWDASAASVASAASASAASAPAPASAAGMPQIYTILVGGTAPAPAPPAPTSPPSNNENENNNEPGFTADPNPQLAPQGTRRRPHAQAGDCTSQMRLCVENLRMGTRTVYVSAADPVTKSVDCGGCASVKVHRRVCTEREDLAGLPTITVAGATRTTTTYVCQHTAG